MKKDIIIIGSGWYGLHSYKFIKNAYGDLINLTVLEKNNDIFNNSSRYNQNRLHLGYHLCHKNTDLLDFYNKT